MCVARFTTVGFGSSWTGVIDLTLSWLSHLLDGPAVPCLQANGTTCFPVNTTELYIDPSPPVALPSRTRISAGSVGRTCLTFMTAEYKVVTHYCH